MGQMMNPMAAVMHGTGPMTAKLQLPFFESHLRSSCFFFGRKANRWIQWRFNARHPRLIFRGSSKALANDRDRARWQVKQSQGCQAGS